MADSTIQLDRRQIIEPMIKEVSAPKYRPHPVGYQEVQYEPASNRGKEVPCETSNAGRSQDSRAGFVTSVTFFVYFAYQFARGQTKPHKVIWERQKGFLPLVNSFRLSPFFLARVPPKSALHAR
jgi:hypothetical protein